MYPMNYEECLTDNQITSLYMEYERLSKERGYSVFPLQTIFNNVSNGERRGTPIREALIGVLDSMVFSASKSLDEMIKLANSDTERIKSSMDIIRDKVGQDTVDFIESNMNKVPPPITTNLSMEQSLYKRRVVDSLESTLEEVAREGLISDSAARDDVTQLVCSLIDQMFVFKNNMVSVLKG